MNELQFFNSEEFGEIRTVTIDGEPWFVGKDVAEILGYSNTRKALADHVDEEDKMDGVTIRDSIGREQNPVCINESGLYSLILSSKMPNAKKFKHWVTSEVLPAIHKTGSYQMQNLSTEMKAILMHDEKIMKIDQRVTGLENTMTIDYGQQKVLGDCVNRVVIDALGGKDSEAYKEIGKKVFSECNRDLKNYFHVNARNNVPKKRFDEAVEYISNWKPCTNTALLIRAHNSQMSIEM